MGVLCIIINSNFLIMHAADGCVNQYMDIYTGGVP